MTHARYQLKEEEFEYREHSDKRGIPDLFPFNQGTQ